MAGMKCCHSVTSVVGRSKMFHSNRQPFPSLKMAITDSSETAVPVYQSTRRHISEDCGFLDQLNLSFSDLSSLQVVCLQGSSRGRCLSSCCPAGRRVTSVAVQCCQPTGWSPRVTVQPVCYQQPCPLWRVTTICTRKKVNTEWRMQAFCSR